LAAKKLNFFHALNRVISNERRSKKIMKKHLIIIFIVFLSSQVYSQPQYENLQPCKVEGAADSVLCGTYAVFENHQTKQGNQINLNIIVTPALNKDSRKSPVFYFGGGHGVAAANAASFFAMSNNPYRRNSSFLKYVVALNFILRAAGVAHVISIVGRLSV
jgi:hypothetical protein